MINNCPVDGSTIAFILFLMAIGLILMTGFNFFHLGQRDGARKERDLYQVLFRDLREQFEDDDDDDDEQDQ